MSTRKDKKRQKKALDKNRRSKEMAKLRQERHLRRKSALKARMEAEAAKPKWSETEFLFWIAHGLNYILSEYSTGTWNPMYDEIYEGRMPPPLATMQRAVMDRYGPDNGQWPPEARAALAFTVLPTEAVYTFYLDARRRVLESPPDGDVDELVRKPHSSPVWNTFEAIKQELAARSA